jgi:hypothetical protein
MMARVSGSLESASICEICGYIPSLRREVDPLLNILPGSVILCVCASLRDIRFEFLSPSADAKNDKDNPAANARPEQPIDFDYG